MSNRVKMGKKSNQKGIHNLDTQEYATTHECATLNYSFNSKPTTQLDLLALDFNITDLTPS